MAGDSAARGVYLASLDGGSSDGRTLSPGSPVALFRTQLATGANVGIGGFASAPQYAVAADGRFLLNVVASDAAVSPITLILNWTALLPR